MPLPYAGRARGFNVRTVSLVVVHCSDSAWGDVRAVREWHTALPPKGRGWKDVGYNYVVLNGHRASRKVYAALDDGLIEAGRDLDHDGDVEEEIGSHAVLFNAHSIGVCLIGPDFTDVQKASAARLVADVCQRYELDPLKDVKGHRELPHVMKQCPLIDMDEFRNAVEAALHPNGRGA
jgi:N-acetylmuramoyl-L-alanine amidase